MKYDYQKALKAWMSGHGGDPDDIQAIYNALCIALKLRPIGFQYRFFDVISGHPVWRDRINEWNGQRPDDTRTIFVLDQVPIDSRPVSPVADHLIENLKALAVELKRVAVLLDAAGYQSKYIEMSGAADMAEVWAQCIDQDKAEGIVK